MAKKEPLYPHVPKSKQKEANIGIASGRTRDFGDSIYTWAGNVETLNQAKYEVDKLRKRGYYARFTQESTYPGHFYSVWMKEKG